LPIAAEHTARLEIGDHRRRLGALERRFAVRAVEAHDADDAGVLRIAVLLEHAKIGDQVPRRRKAAAPAPLVEGADFVFAREAVAADRVQRVGQVEAMRPLAGIVVDIRPIIDHQPVQRVPQRDLVPVFHRPSPPPSVRPVWRVRTPRFGEDYRSGGWLRHPAAGHRRGVSIRP